MNIFCQITESPSIKWETQSGGHGQVSLSHKQAHIADGMIAYYISETISKLEVQYSTTEILAGYSEMQIKCSVRGNFLYPIVVSATIDFTCKCDIRFGWWLTLMM